jgi:DNA-binding transcriptional MerR regulator
MTADERIYIGEIEQELGRSRSTLRTWERFGWLPAGCEFHRDERGWRFWTPAQVQAVKEWMALRNPGRTRRRVTGA